MVCYQQVNNCHHFSSFPKLQHLFQKPIPTNAAQMCAIFSEHSILADTVGYDSVYCYCSILVVKPEEHLKNSMKTSTLLICNRKNDIMADVCATDLWNIKWFSNIFNKTFLKVFQHKLFHPYFPVWWYCKMIVILVQTAYFTCSSWLFLLGSTSCVLSQYRVFNMAVVCVFAA